MFIRASNWILHLKSLEQMLPLFASTGHIHYTKCARLYLQMMQRLPDDYPFGSATNLLKKKSIQFLEPIKIGEVFGLIWRLSKY